LQRKLAGIFGGRRGGPAGDGPGRTGIGGGLIGFVLVVLAGLWALTGFYKIDAAERGVVLRFGEYTATTQPGLRWHIPWPIERVEKINTGATERWTYQGSMLTRDENIVIVDLVVQYRRTDPLRYLFSLRSPEDTLRDVTASAIREIMGKNILDFILTEGRAEIALQTQELLQSTLDSYETGITVYEVNLQEANFPREVEVSVQDAIKAREDREREILSAEAYRNDILPRARGQAARQIQDAEAYHDRVIADAEGEADRFKSILTAYQKAPGVTRERLYIETLEQVLSTSSKVLVDTEGGNNMLYLPLDQLGPRRRMALDEQQQLNNVPLSQNVSPRDARERGSR
jgi:membrane protease subunit HflK